MADQMMVINSARARKFRRHMPATRPTWARTARILGPLMTTGIVLAGLLIGGYAAGTGPAWAAGSAPRGPSVGADQFDDQFVFWRGTQNQLEEADYDAYAGAWSGPINLGMGPLGSEPSVAVSNTGGYLHGGNRYGAQYVYWEGTGSQDLWLAYWTGDWHGPYRIDVGPLASQPAASFIDVGGSSQVAVFWKGQDGNLWYTLSSDPTNTSSYSSATPASFNGRGFGPLGSSPGAANSIPTSVQCCGNQNPGTVTWQGMDGQAWQAQFNIDYGGKFSWISGPTSNPFGTIGSPPSADVEYAPAADGWMWDYVWKGSGNDSAWYAAGSGANGYGSSELFQRAFQIPGTDGLASAPAIAWSAARAAGIGSGAPQADLYVFWKGQDGYLHEAYFDGRTFTWHVYTFKQFGTLG